MYKRMWDLFIISLYILVQVTGARQAYLVSSEGDMTVLKQPATEKITHGVVFFINGEYRCGWSSCPDISHDDNRCEDESIHTCICLFFNFLFSFP